MWPAQAFCPACHSFSRGGAENGIGAAGATEIAELLQVNTTLVKIYLVCESRAVFAGWTSRRWLTRAPQPQHTGNGIGEGAADISRALATNYSVKKVYLGGVCGGNGGSIVRRTRGPGWRGSCHFGASQKTASPRPAQRQSRKRLP